MIIERPQLDKLYIPLERQKAEAAGVKTEPDVKFTDTLSSFMQDVNKQQIEAADATDKFLKGDPVDIHDVMISAEKAKTTFQLLMELRNKGLDLYREVLRIQV